MVENVGDDSFIFATNHYLKQYFPNIEHKWYGSSLTTEFEEKMEGEHLGDEYGLRKLYSSNWLMDSSNNGDVTNLDVIQNIKDKIMKYTNNEGVDLYTSDISAGIIENRELNEAILNAGQIVCGLMTLKKGGNMITKQFTFFLKYTRSIMGILIKNFDIVKIIKPQTSRPANSEIYLLCKNYKGKVKCRVKGSC